MHSDMRKYRFNLVEFGPNTSSTLTKASSSVETMAIAMRCWTEDTAVLGKAKRTVSRSGGRGPEPGQARLKPR